MKNPNSPRRSLLAGLAPAILPLMLVASGCELISSVDRSTISGGDDTGQGGDPNTPTGAQGGVGAQSGSGGRGGSGQAGKGNESGSANEAGSAGQGAGGEPGAGAGTGGSSSAGEGGAPQGGAPQGGAPQGGAPQGGAAGESTSGGAGGANGGPAGKIIYLAGPKKATFGGISGADAVCNASPPAGGGTYKALIVDGTTRRACTTANCGGGATEHVDWVLAADTTYVRADQARTVIGTTNSAGIFSFPLDASIDTAGYAYWTGLSADWTSNADDCSHWSETSGFFATQGLGDATDDQAIVGVSDSCASLAGAFIACVEQ